MKKFIRGNWFKIIIILLLFGFFIIYIKNNYISTSELYKINQNCAEQALSFAKSQSNEHNLWQVHRNIFDKTKGACFAEFWITSLGELSRDKYEIYDLTHNKYLSFVPVHQEDIDETSLFIYRENYNKISREIFGK
jgi:hypothetical protein